MHRPIALAGDRVAVVSPSGPSDPADVAAGIARLRARFDVTDDPRCIARTGYLAGDEAMRAGALLDALRDPHVRAVLATRGGYGALRVLEAHGDALSTALARDPKPLVGFSDVTALHAVWARVGVRSVHGPMVAAIGRGIIASDELDELFAVLAGNAPTAWTDLATVTPGRARGRAVGGNLALVAALHGTPFALPTEATVLFLEDTGERPYRVDRMLTSLRLGGALRGVRAIVLGDFSDAVPGPDGVRIDDVLRERLGDRGIPVVAQAPFGHAGRHRAIPFGDLVEVVADARGSVSFGGATAREVASTRLL